MLALTPETIGLIGALCIFIVVGTLSTFVRCYKKVSQGQALIRNGIGGTWVSFSGKFVIPIIHKAEYLDITLKRLVVEQKVTCRDGIDADVKAAFFVRVNNAVEDVKKVVAALGVKRAADPEVLYELFSNRFIKALEAVSGQHDYETLTNREQFKDRVIEAVGRDLDGFFLDVVAIDYFEKI